MRILITAGGTREYIDPVRFISNTSSGIMGIALTRAALKAGHKVTLIIANSKSEIRNQKLKTIKVETTNQMFEVVKKYFPKCNCLIMAAAVADYTPAQPSKTKIKRANKSLTLKLKPTIDILKWAGKYKKKGQMVVGFALEDRNLRTNAEKKLKEKNLDMIITNPPSAIGSEKATVQIKTRSSNWSKIQNTTKAAIAKKIIRLIDQSIKMVGDERQIGQHWFT
jgi:phosphopantothenoylcysteine decarboxylase/phosphopantothenate--cysteine ligase